MKDDSNNSGAASQAGHLHQLGEQISDTMMTVEMMSPRLLLLPWMLRIR